MIRCAYSIPSNIAEGNSRNTTKEYVNYLYIARGSINELKYFLLLSKDLKYLNLEVYSDLKEKCGILENALKRLDEIEG